MEIFVQEDYPINLISEEIAKIWIQTFLDSMESVWAVKTLQFSKQEKKSWNMMEVRCWKYNTETWLTIWNRS